VKNELDSAKQQDEVSLPSLMMAVQEEKDRAKAFENRLYEALVSPNSSLKKL
jgi:hypothetical protein